MANGPYSNPTRAQEAPLDSNSLFRFCRKNRTAKACYSISFICRQNCQFSPHGQPSFMTMHHRPSLVLLFSLGHGAVRQRLLMMAGTRVAQHIDLIISLVLWLYRLGLWGILWPSCEATERLASTPRLRRSTSRYLAQLINNVRFMSDLP